MPVEGDELIAAVNKFPDVLEDAGITDELLAESLYDELHAHEQKATYDKDAGRFFYSKKMIAWSVRQKARIDAHKLKNQYPAEKREITGANGAPILVIHEKENK